MKRCRLAVRACLDVGITVKKDLHSRLMVVARGEVQRSPLICLPCFDVRIVCEQKLHNSLVAIHCGEMQRGPLIGVPRLDVDIPIKKKPSDKNYAVVRSQQELDDRFVTTP